MLYSTLLVAAAAFSGFVSAQNSSTPIGDCCTVPANEVSDDLKESWCRAQTNTCPEICGGLGQVANGGNTCDDVSIPVWQLQTTTLTSVLQSTLDFTCECRNGTEPNMDEYQQSVPGQMCRFWFDKCINATGENLDEQFQCTTQRDTRCGNKTTRADSTASASASGTAAQTGGGSDSSASATSTGSSSSQSSGAAAALTLAREFGTPVLAGGMIALFGFAL